MGTGSFFVGLWSLDGIGIGWRRIVVGIVQVDIETAYGEDANTKLTTELAQAYHRKIDQEVK